MGVQQAWLDAEVEKVLEQKNALDLMQKVCVCVCVCVYACVCV